MVEVMTPPMTAVDMGARNSDPSPRESAVGSMPSTIAAEVIRMGRSRVGPASSSASTIDLPRARSSLV